MEKFNEETDTNNEKTIEDTYTGGGRINKDIYMYRVIKWIYWNERIEEVRNTEVEVD